MPAPAERKRSSTSAKPPNPRRGVARRNVQLETRLATRTSSDLAPLVDLDRRAAGSEESPRSPGPGYGHGV